MDEFASEEVDDDAGPEYKESAADIAAAEVRAELPDDVDDEPMPDASAAHDMDESADTDLVLDPNKPLPAERDGDDDESDDSDSYDDDPDEVPPGTGPTVKPILTPVFGRW